MSLEDTDQHCPTCECNKPYIAKRCPNCKAEVFCLECGTEL